jgi:hypothetical protein
VIDTSWRSSGSTPRLEVGTGEGLAEGEGVFRKGVGAASRVAVPLLASAPGVGVPGGCTPQAATRRDRAAAMDRYFAVRLSMPLAKILTTEFTEFNKNVESFMSNSLRT